MTMSDEDMPQTVGSGDPYKVGIMPTEHGERVILIIRAGEADEVALWLDLQTAKSLGKSLTETAGRIEANGTDRPPTKN